MAKEDKIKKYGEGGGTSQGSGGSPGSASSSSSSNRNYYESPKKKKKKKKKYRDGGKVEWTEKDEKRHKQLVRQKMKNRKAGRFDRGMPSQSWLPKHKQKELNELRKKHKQSIADERSFGEEFKRQRKRQEFMEKDDPTGETYKEKYKEFEWRGKKYTARHKDEPKDKRKQKKKRYGGSVSYSSGSVRGYSKTYAGMGGDDE